MSCLVVLVKPVQDKKSPQKPHHQAQDASPQRPFDSSRAQARSLRGRPGGPLPPTVDLLNAVLCRVAGDRRTFRAHTLFMFCYCPSSSLGAKMLFCFDLWLITTHSQIIVTNNADYLPSPPALLSPRSTVLPMICVGGTAFSSRK